MSNFIKKVKHPKTGKLTEATFLDNYFGRHEYGIQFKGKDKVYKESELNKLNK